MTAYQGGKAKIAKDVYRVLKQYDKGQDYLEPFIGMGSVMKLFCEEKNDRGLYGSDTNPDLILLLKALQKGYQPPKSITKSQYENIRNETKHSALRGFVGIASSYNGIFMHNYCSAKTEAASRNLPIAGKIMKRVHLKKTDYSSLNPKGMLIYADPPYEGTLPVNFFKGFDSRKFWNTMRRWSKNNTVIISEYKAPDDFKCIWSKEIKLRYGMRTEKLFILR